MNEENALSGLGLMAPPPPSEGRGETTTLPAGKVECPKCGKVCRAAGLRIHMYRSHTAAGAGHSARITMANASRDGSGHVRRRGPGRKAKAETRAERRERQREWYRLNKSKAALQAKASGQQAAPTPQPPAPAGIAFCPCCGTDLKPFQMASAMAHKFSNGKH